MEDFAGKRCSETSGPSSVREPYVFYPEDAERCSETSSISSVLPYVLHSEDAERCWETSSPSSVLEPYVLYPEDAERCSETSSPSSALQPYVLHPEDASPFSYMFSFSTENTGIRKVTSDTFMAGGYKWALDFYPNGTRSEDDQYISLFITLESNTTDVIARFELILVDQSTKGKHRIQTIFGTETPCLMKHQGSQWGFRRYIKKSHLKKKSYLKDGFLMVKCSVGVLYPVLADQVEYSEPIHSPMMLDEVEELEDHSFEDGKISLLDSAVNILLETEPGALFNGERDKFDQYLHAFDEVQQSIRLRNISGYKIRGINLIQTALERLLLEFRNILEWSIDTVEDDTLCSTDCSSCMATSCSQELLEGDHTGRGALSSEQIYRLHCMSERLNSAGRLQECVDVYKNLRKSVVNASFSRFGIGNWFNCDIRSLDWDEFAKKIKFWIRAAQMCFLIIIPREKQIYEQIFDGLEDVPFDSFLVIVEDFAIQLCNFAEIISCSPALLQKLFDVLDLYKFLSLYLPDIKATFYSTSTRCISAQAESTLQRLAELVRQIISSFENAVLHDTTISRATLHSLTRYTMERVIRMVHYNELLTEIITSEPTTSFVGSNEMQYLEVGARNPLAHHLLWIIISLKFNLKAKFKEYKDTHLGHLFLMNNIHYIVEEIKGSYEMLEMIGEDYVTKLNEDVMEEAKSYLGSWDKVLYCFRDEGLHYKVFYSGISKNALKDRFKILNATFEEIFQTQSTWFVPDLKLREQLHKSILEKLLPPYKSFLLQYKSERYIKKYIKYSPEELHNVVYDLFC